ncbi:MAG: hypothetical protein WAL95_18715 [Candidatus Acidiferrales bacterium]
MKRGIALASCLAGLAALLLPATAARADEIKLKDGSKIIGTIVGFEDNSFKVKTSYGFAVVQKDQVVSIVVTDSAKKPEPNAPKTATAAAAPASAATPAPNSPSAKTEKAEHAVAAPPKPAATDSASNDVVEYPHTDAPSASANSAPSSEAVKNPPQPKVTPVAAPPPPKPAAPEPMREAVSGNTYTNDTYGFRMYKPPDWHVIAGASKILPGAITAMGTDDQTTYLMIGQETGGKSLTSVIDAADKRLHDVMDNFRPLDEKHVTISGVTAIERRFRGSVDEHDWSGVAVYIPRGNSVYTIFGMTLASTDLVQIQENVISRAITSLQFTK